jgi:hypothetical protein
MIHFLLFFGMDWAERHPSVMLALLALLICLASAIDPIAPYL